MVLVPGGIIVRLMRFFSIELFDPNGHLVAFVDDVGDFANAAGGHLGDVQQTVAADADINKRAVFRRLFDRTAGLHANR